MKKINLNLYRSNIYNKIGLREAPHYGEDGVILKIFEVIRPNKIPYIVEFGETRSLGTTTRAFRIMHKSKALYFTSSINLYSRILNILDIILLVIKKKSFSYFSFLLNLPKQLHCTESNIIGIFKNNSVPNKLDILTIDIDSNDFFIARKILEGGYRPNLLILEYNPNLPINSSLAVKNVQRYSNKRVYGASLLAMSNLANIFGYHLIHISGFCNLFFVNKDYSKYFETPDICVEFCGSKEKILAYIKKYCLPGFLPSWLDSTDLSEDDLALFEKI